MYILHRYIGIYGNADPLDANQWLSMSVSEPSSISASWSDETGICSGVVTGKCFVFFICGCRFLPEPTSLLIFSLVVSSQYVCSYIQY